MTKIVILSQEPEEKEKKKIEFVNMLNPVHGILKATINPNNYEYIELICRNYSPEFDIMFAYDDDRSKGVLFIGHFNDGVV